MGIIASLAGLLLDALKAYVKPRVGHRRAYIIIFAVTYFMNFVVK